MCKRAALKLGGNDSNDTLLGFDFESAWCMRASEDSQFEATLMFFRNVYTQNVAYPPLPHLPNRLIYSVADEACPGGA